MIKVTAYLKINESFYINGHVVIDHLEVGVDEFTYNSSFSMDIENGEVISKQVKDDIYTNITVKHDQRLVFNYHGDIQVPRHTSQTKKEGYLEVDSIHSAVIPYLSSFLTYDIEIYLQVPELYCVAGYEYKEGYYYKHDYNPCIAFVMFKRDLINIVETSKVTVYAFKYHDIDKVKRMAEISCYIMNRYIELFGDCDNDHLYLVLNPRFDNGAYARNNIIYLVDRIEGLDLDTFMHIAHEISHLWWKFAADWHHNNWINETFAQYSALIMLREYYGEKAYMSYIENFKQYLDKSSLSSVDDNTSHDIRFDIHYYKGPYLFYLLEQEIGHSKMVELIKTCYLKKIGTSEEFLSFCPLFDKYYKL